MKINSVTQRFVFLELRDDEINNLLSSLREIFQNEKSNSSIHVTVRGPYYKELTTKNMSYWKSLISSDYLLVANPGMFVNKNIYVVYIGLTTDNLKKIWHKPDFPIEKYGFNPHVSLYVGSNERYAKDILAFLKKERIELVTTEFELTTYVTKQLNLFEDKTDYKKFFKLCNSGKVRDDILERAFKLYKKHR